MNEHFVVDQGRPRGAARRRRDLHGRRAGDDRPRRLADERLPHARRRAVLRRHVLPRREPRTGCRRSREVLTRIAELWESGPRRGPRGRRAQLAAALPRRGERPDAGAAAGGLDSRDARRGRRAARDATFDREHGGWGGAPKFPQPMVARVRCCGATCATGDATMLDMVTATLDAMARGGIYDQLGGGFHRYSDDDVWLVPHFEKMLYDNAQLARVYLHAWQVTGDELYRRVAAETLDYVAARDARRERRLLLGAGRRHRGRGGPLLRLDARGDPQRSGLLARRRGRVADRRGPVHGGVRRHRGRQLRGQVDPVRRALGGAARPAQRDGRGRGRGAARPRARDALRGARGARQAGPGRQGARRLERPDARRVRRGGARAAVATTTARSPSATPTSCSPRCARRTAACCAPGRRARAKLNGYLEDYAHVADGLLELYQTTFEPRWFDAARELGDCDPRALRRPGRRLLRHERRPRGAAPPPARTSKTARCPRAARWRPRSCSGWPSTRATAATRPPPRPPSRACRR